MPGPEEAQLVLGARVARGQLAQVRVDVLLGPPAGRSSGSAQAHGLGDLAVEELLAASRTPIAASIASRSAGVMAV